MAKKISFASDNHTGIHPNILQAIHDVNVGDCPSYGADEYTRKTTDTIRKELNAKDVFFVFNGTAANVLSLSSMLKPYQAIICASSAHINVDECGAPEKFTGSKLLSIQTADGKLTPELIKPYLSRVGDQHYTQPKVISITQATEWGTVYTPQEIRALTDFAHKNNILVHVDGARIYNAAVSLNTSLKAITADCGIDALSLGGTKNGLMLGEAVIFFNKNLSENFTFIRKQGMQLSSKMRYIAAQFQALFTDNLWQKNAQQANSMAQLLAEELEQFKEIKPVQPVTINQVFVTMPKEIIETIQKEFPFYVWDEEKSIVRLMTSWNTTEENIKLFINLLKTTF